MITRLLRDTRARRHVSAIAALAAAALVALPLTSCERLPLVAPSSSAITLSAPTTALPLNGSTEITASVVEEGGTAVENGTLVTFSTTLGSLDPREVRTQSGRAATRFLAGSLSGTASIGAASGGVATTNPLQIRVGGAAADRILMSVNPSTVPVAGGTVQITTIVLDANSNRLPLVPVTFTSSAGVLSASNATTDISGEARVALTTTREATVTATAGTQIASFTVRVTSAPVVTLAASTTSAQEGQPLSFSLSVAVGANGAGIQSVVVNFGDGESVSLGAVVGTIQLQHVYRRSGIYTATATVTDTSGERSTTSTQVVVQRIPPLGVTLSASSTTPRVQTVVTFTAQVQAQGASAAIQNYNWDFGDGTRADTSGASTTHVYGSSGHKVVTLTVLATNGASGFAQIEILVQR